MTVHSPVGVIRASLLALALVVMVTPAKAQQPSASAIALAKDIIVAKGSSTMYDPIVPGVVDRIRALLIQTSPMLSRELNEVTVQLKREYASRIGEPINEMARLYAARFTEQELKDALAFYKSPLGVKIINEEPAILEASLERMQAWREKFSEEVVIKFRNEMRKKGHEL
jgi:hypothetical protein